MSPSSRDLPERSEVWQHMHGPLPSQKAHISQRNVMIGKDNLPTHDQTSTMVAFTDGSDRIEEVNRKAATR